MPYVLQVQDVGFIDHTLVVLFLPPSAFNELAPIRNLTACAVHPTTEEFRKGILTINGEYLDSLNKDILDNVTCDICLKERGEA